MKFLADENVPQTLIKNLRDEGFDVLDIKKSKYRCATGHRIKSGW